MATSKQQQAPVQGATAEHGTPSVDAANTIVAVAPQPVATAGAPPAGVEPAPGFEGLSPEEQLTRHLDFLGLGEDGTEIVLDLAPTGGGGHWMRLALVQRDREAADPGVWVQVYDELVTGSANAKAAKKARRAAKTAKQGESGSTLMGMRSWLLGLPIEGHQGQTFEVFFKVNQFRGAGFGVGRQDVVATQLYVAEIDSGSLLEQWQRILRLQELGLRVNAVVASGGKSLHIFIRAPKGMPVDWVRDVRINRKLAVTFQGDHRVWNRDRSMRLAGFERPGKGQQTLLTGTVNELYTSVEQLEDVIDQVLLELGIANWEEAYRALGGDPNEVDEAGSDADPGELVSSGPDNPCPVCGRTKGACTIYLDGDRRRVNCFHGQTFWPPKTTTDPFTGRELDLMRGDVVDGKQEGRWAFSRVGWNPGLGGSFSAFVEHRPTATDGVAGDDTHMRSEQGQTPARTRAEQEKRSHAGVRKALEELAAKGISGPDLTEALCGVAQYAGRPLRDLKAQYEEILRQKEAAAERESSMADLMRLYTSDGIDLEALTPPALLEALKVMRTFADYRLDVLLAVLMTGLSGALPLDSEVELNAEEDFRQPLALFALLLMPSGEQKSPLLERLLRRPWMEGVAPVIDEAYQKRLEEWEADAVTQPRPPRPRKPQTLVTEDATTQGLETHMEIHDLWANRSMCIWLDEGKGALQQMVDRDGGKGRETPFGGWLLSRYDGSGASGAKVDQARERNYKRCRVALVTCCQPDVYREITGDGDQTGMSARFIVVEQNLVEQTFPTEVDANRLHAAELLHETLVRCYRKLAETDRLRLWLSPEAFKLFQEERAAMYQRKRKSVSSAERSLVNKMAGRIGRLAALFHILWTLLDQQKGRFGLGNGGAISAENMQRAILFNRLLLDQTLGVRLTSADNGAEAGLMLKLQRRAWEVKEPVALSDLRKGLSSKNRPDPAVVLQALRELARHGFGELEEAEYRTQRGWKYTALKPMEVGVTTSKGG